MMNGTLGRLLVFGAVVSLASSALVAVTPPALINYQGVLRDASNKPLTGTYDMTFSFYDLPTGGTLEYADAHTGPGGVVVTGGLFSVALGSGVYAGGFFPSLPTMCAQISPVYLEVRIGPDTLSPRTQLVAAPFALNADRVDGWDSTNLAKLDQPNTFPNGPQTLGTGQSDAIALEVDAAPFQEAPLQVWRDELGQVAASVDPTGSITGNNFLGSGEGLYNVNATFLFGQAASYYLNTSSGAQTKSGPLTVSAPAAGYGLQSQGNGVGYAQIGTGAYGLKSFGAYPSGMGGFFKDLTHTGEAWVADGDSGVIGYGTFAGGIFRNGTPASYGAEAFVGYPGLGISATGTTAGGYFADSNGTGNLYAGNGDLGAWSKGSIAGGFFADADAANTGFVYLGHGDRGLTASGTEAGAFLTHYSGSGYAWVGLQDKGISGHGTSSGGHFEDGYGNYADIGTHITPGSSVGFAISGRASHAGADFFVGNYWSQVGTSDGYKVTGNGTVGFVQNHPEDAKRVIVYHAPESSDVAVFSRGSGRLAGGEARIALDPTFGWVTNPDLGLTAYLTEREPTHGLYVASVSTSEIVVREKDGGRSNAAFDYIVYGLRIGFEEMAPIQPKRHESPVQATTPHQEIYAEHPELRAYNGLERFRGIAKEVDGTEEVDLSRSQALRARLALVDPAALPPMQPLREVPTIGPAPEPADPRHGATHAGASALPADRADSRGLASPGAPPGQAPAPACVPDELLVDVDEPVAAGDLLAVDPAHPRLLHRSATAEDPLVAGVVGGEAGSIWTGRAPLSPAGAITTLRVDAAFGAIRPGDLLVSSPTPGHAMRAEDPRPGIVVGKALERLDFGEGAILVLVAPR